MSGLRRTIIRVCACAFAVTVLGLLPRRAEAQVINPLRNPFYNPLLFPPIIPIPVPVNPNAIGNNGGGVTRATSSLANPINFYQYGQVTGVGPIRGSVRIYNQFGLLAQDQNQAGLGGLNSLFGGLGNNNQQLPGQGNTQGDDSPQGVLLHVNYAQMFLPNQQQLNAGNGGGIGGLRGGFGGFAGGLGYGGGFGKGYFGNGANGL